MRKCYRSELLYSEVEWCVNVCIFTMLHQQVYCRLHPTVVCMEHSFFCAISGKALHAMQTGAQ